MNSYQFESGDTTNDLTNAVQVAGTSGRLSGIVHNSGDTNDLTFTLQEAFTASMDEDDWRDIAGFTGIELAPGERFYIERDAYFQDVRLMIESTTDDAHTTYRAGLSI